MQEGKYILFKEAYNVKTGCFCISHCKPRLFKLQCKCLLIFFFENKTTLKDSHTLKARDLKQNVEKALIDKKERQAEKESTLKKVSRLFSYGHFY